MTKHPFVKSTMLAAAIAASGLLLSGCNSVQRTDARLEQAHSQFSNLKAKSNVGAVAPIELKDAQEALSTADQALAERKDKTDLDHKIYLAQQRVAIAEDAYKRKLSEADAKALNDNRDKLRLEARTAEAERAKAELAQLKELQAKSTDRGIVMTLGDVLFDVGKADLKSGGVRVVAQLAGYLSANPNRKVSVEGHTDSTGSDEFNQKLSENRAGSVKATLVGAGISPDRIVTQGLGEAFPVADNDSPSGRQLNRRVEIVLSDEEGNIKPR
jgi:outer membrane protein OmpA-like peptidoglycan-associated protein